MLVLWIVALLCLLLNRSCCDRCQIQCNATDSVRCNKIDVILITHLHGDHSFGLPGML